MQVDHYSVEQIHGYPFESFEHRSDEVDIDTTKATPRITFNSLPDFLQVIDPFLGLNWIFRGQANGDWPLLPKAGRGPFALPPMKDRSHRFSSDRDLGRLNRWKRLAVSCGPVPDNEFHMLAHAQHHGLATRLLDWSGNPLVALFFAVDSCSDEAGSVFAYSPRTYIQEDHITPLEVLVVACVHPPAFNARILAQDGLFTYHPQPRVELRAMELDDEFGRYEPSQGSDLVRFDFDPKLKRYIKNRLQVCGISRASLFPGLDGLSDMVNWETFEMANPYDFPEDDEQA